MEGNESKLKEFGLVLNANIVTIDFNVFDAFIEHRIGNGNNTHNNFKPGNNSKQSASSNLQIYWQQWNGAT